MTTTRDAGSSRSNLPRRTFLRHVATAASAAPFAPAVIGAAATSAEAQTTPPARHDGWRRSS
jgi:hypothetical protein